MRKVNIIRRDGNYDQITTYNIYDFPYDKLKPQFIKMGHKHNAQKGYSTNFATFDIETTTIKPKAYQNWLAKGKKDKLERSDAPYGFMYHWQMCVGGLVCCGRTWEEWIDFMEAIKKALNIDNEWHLIIYVFNLAFEFQFIRNFLQKEFGGYQVFAAAPRKPIHVTTNNGFQFRCAYKLTNMSLEKATDTELGVTHIKAAGDLDYSIPRYFDTELSDTEYGYCVSDVVSLYELIQAKLKEDKDSLETIPLTSTGYVRRDMRKACRNADHYRTNVFLKQQMTPDVYTLLEEAGRGGNVHANRFMSGRVWHNADSYDEVSGYPAMQLLMAEFTTSKFMRYGDVENIAELDQLCTEYCTLFRVVFRNLRIKPKIPMPYLPVSKALDYNMATCKLDNGRVLTCSAIAYTLTNIDWEIVKLQYEWDDIAIADLHIARKGLLPEPIRNTVFKYFESKCKLKIAIQNYEAIKEPTPEEEAKLEDAKYYYMKSKNKLNAIFGCSYTNPIRGTISIDEATGIWESNSELDLQFELDKFYRSRNSFLVYAWGVWTTALNRRHLETLLQACGGYGRFEDDPRSGEAIYCDTDSCKCVGVDESLINELNDDIIRLNEEYNAYCEVEGQRFYIGTYEHENSEPIKEFKTLGAKKYAYTDERGFHITISGVNKKLGAKEMDNISNFVPGFIFKDAGGTTLYYNDLEDGVRKITVAGRTFTTASNIGIVDSTYELGITEEYAELIGYNVYENVDNM